MTYQYAKDEANDMDAIFSPDLKADYTLDSFVDSEDPFAYSLTLSPFPPSTIDSIFNSPSSSVEEIMFSVSTAFHPTAHPFLPPADTLLVSNDGIIFYVHSIVILKASATAFKTVIGGFLDDPSFRNAAVQVPIPSAELNIILHLLYDLLPANPSPTLDNLINAVDMMPAFSLSPRELIPPKSPLRGILLSIAPLHPMDVYMLAAHHSLHDLAVGSSAHLLAYPLDSITDDQARRMGPIYLRKLVCLRLNRIAALKNILLHAPYPHAPSKLCGFSQQNKLTRAWALAISCIVWDSGQDLSTHGLQSTLGPLTEDMECRACHSLLQARIRDVIVQWTAVERTI